ncbi:hypothetical protein GCM10011380_17790 [Sphingomonas metalli]|jgi:hypothetical protein|uniref:Uncharacterized protein n=1 Tax=Sphingomonas metalli TaxID=1779358 RepID=A0A916WTC3_9SPHN|nr:hypothetical protein [Sphingomonas metalli]GGB28603.1 hypothetical protein GCM10011380_17790 [Sphingomonas metalli]
MGEGTDSPILAVLLICVAGSVVLAAIGIWLHRTRRLTSRRAALVWAILTLVPLFGAGFAMMTRHTVDMATGETRAGVNEPPPTR